METLQDFTDTIVWAQSERGFSVNKNLFVEHQHTTTLVKRFSHNSKNNKPC